MTKRLYMVSFDGETYHWMDGGFTEVDTLFIVAYHKQLARVIAANNARHGWLTRDSKMEIIDLGLTDKPLSFCTDDWNILTPEQYELIFEAEGIPCDPDEPNALDALCYDTTPAPDDDPREWTLNGGR